MKNIISDIIYLKTLVLDIEIKTIWLLCKNVA